MWAVTVALLLHSTTAPAGASRVKLREAGALQQRTGSASTWLRKSERWCTSSEATVSCDDESIIDVYSAFYALAWSNKCELGAGSGEESCEKNATDRVLPLCQGRRSCAVPASLHPSCAGEPHYSIRIVWNCVTGDPATAAADTQHADVALEAHVAPDTPHVDIPLQAAPNYTPASDAKKPGRSGDAKKEGAWKGVQWEAVKAVKSEAEKLVKQPNLEVSFNPCYRRTRWSLLSEWKLFARLTTCPSNEGCFKLTWDDGKTFEDPMESPDRRAILQAQLAHGDDSAVTWFGIGLQRNDYGTWGVCLPKTEGVNFAMAVFNSLKEY